MTAQERAKQILFEYREGINPNLKDLEQGIAAALEAAATDARLAMFDQIYTMFSTTRGEIPSKAAVLQLLDVTKPYLMGEKP